MSNAVDLDGCKAVGTVARKATISYSVVGALFVTPFIQKGSK